MHWLKRFWTETLFKNERLILSFIFLFTIGNWCFLALAEKLGPPDFYKLYGVAEKLYSGDLKVGIIPPLFSLLMYPLGKLLGLFVPSREAFILAGRIIALAASFGVIWFSYLILKKITGKWALLGLSFLVISPWFLKLISFPITDMLYLFFVTAAFYTFLNPAAPGLSFLAVIGGVLTRFEGVLLILCGIINYFKSKKKVVYLLLGVIPPLLIFFLVFTPRIYDHLKDIILPRKSYLFIFRHPLEFFNVIYGNILFFIPNSYPNWVQYACLLVVFVFFLYGVYRLFKINKSFTISIVVYEFLFLVAKGYIDTADPGEEFRRVFSGLWIFYFISFIGCYFLLRGLGKRTTREENQTPVSIPGKPAKDNKTLQWDGFLKRIKPYIIPKIIVLMGGGVLFAAVVFSLEMIRLPVLLVAVSIILPVLYSLKGLSMGKIPRYIAIIVLLAFAFQAYYLAYREARRYIVAYPNKAAYAAAQWFNQYGRFKEGTVVLSYTDTLMLHYYLKKEKEGIKDLQWIELAVPMRYEDDKNRFKELFLSLLRENRVDYIVFDNYVVRKPEFVAVNDVKNLLYDERKNSTCFKLRNLFYKRKNVGYILKTVGLK